MNDQKLAQALVKAGLLSAPQIHAAAGQRAGGISLAQVILDQGWLSEQQMEPFITESNGGEPIPVRTPVGPALGNGKTPAAKVSSAASTVGLGQDAPSYMNYSGVVLEDDKVEASEAVQLCNQLLQQALAMRASDLHLQPMENGLMPRFRVDAGQTANIQGQ